MTPFIWKTNAWRVWTVNVNCRLKIAVCVQILWANVSARTPNMKECVSSLTDCSSRFSINRYTRSQTHIQTLQPIGLWLHINWLRHSVFVNEFYFHVLWDLSRDRWCQPLTHFSALVDDCSSVSPSTNRWPTTLWGVPQVSILGLLLFNMCLLPLAQIIIRAFFLSSSLPGTWNL